MPEARTTTPDSPTPLAEALATVGDRWTLRVVAALVEGPRRFGDLQREVEGIAPNVLSERLRRLTDQGLVVAQAYSERPPRFTYELTETGRGLAGPIRMLAEWAAGRSGGSRVTHAACGAPLEATLWCPTCREPVPEDEASELDYA
jgi:DNA-binding HxlR family transcriptional regulator